MSPAWTDRIWREYRAGTLTRTYRDVLLTLRTYRGRGGLICPGHETLADRAGCSVSTVQRALHHARRLGLVSWSERRIRSGWRWLRTSNTYALTIPDAPIEPNMRPTWWRRRTTGQVAVGGENEENKMAHEGRRVAIGRMIREAAVLPDLLARRRDAVAALLLTRSGGAPRW
jgi:uncharacterized protein RhaS with RHS repeats